MTSKNYDTEIQSYLERAEQSLRAAQELVQKNFYDAAASRAYYSAFYASAAALLRLNLGLSKHSGVIANIHQKYVKTGKLSKEHGKALNWLFELRNIGDYGITTHVTKEEAEKAIRAAQNFTDAIKTLPDEKE